MSIERLQNKKIIIWSFLALAFICLVIIGVLLILNVTKNNYIKTINSEVESVYTTFENTDYRTEKYNILTDFIADSENYSKYQEIEKNYQSKISEMKKYFVVSYENLIEENSINISDKTTKEELSTAISHLNEAKKTISSNKVIQIEDFISEINSKIKIYETKIAEIEDAEKAEEERLKKEAEEKAKKEAEEKAKQEAAKKATESKKNNTSEDNLNNSEGVDSNSSTPVFNPNKPYRYHWDVDENGNEIPGTRTYDDYCGNVWDENYNYLGNIYYDSWEEMFGYDISDIFE